MAGKSDEATGWSETLRTRLMTKMDALIDAFLATEDPAEKARIEKDARTCGVFARAAKAIAAMVPPPKAQPAARDDAANDDEASMHDGIPDDPEDLHAALAERFAHVAALIEQKRRAVLDGGANPGSPAGAERDARQAPGTPAGPGS